MTFSAIASVLLSWLSRTLRGFLLILWIYFLAVAAYISLRPNDIIRFIDLDSDGRFASVGLLTLPSDECPDPFEIVSTYGRTLGELPAADLLDVLAPGWNEPQRVPCSPGDKKAIQKLRSTYEDACTRIASGLRAAALSDTTSSRLKFDQHVLPAALVPPSEAKVIDIDLPLSVQQWSAQFRNANKEKQRQVDLIGTFLLLGVLGAFGSLVFLIRDYVADDVEKKFSDYVFRPVLGIFLSIAVFVVDICAHAIISTASVLEVRREPLLLLAFAAGLLSESMYDVVSERVRQAVAEWKKAQVPRPAPSGSGPG